MQHRDRDPTDLRGQDAEQVEADSKKRARRETELDDVRHTMGSRQGRRLMWRLISAAGVYRESANLGLAEMALEKGMKVQGLLLIDEIHAACPEQYEVMKRESRNAR